MPHFFISYRRSDQEGQYLAHMIFRELRRRYGEKSVFLDVDSRSPGLSFPVKVAQALSVTDVVLVIIGPAWLKILTERLEDSRDWVRYEIAESLKRSWLPVVPVCRAGVEMPRPHQLPEDLKDLGWRDGVILDPFQDFDRHLDRLLSDLERVLATSSREKLEALELAAQKAKTAANQRVAAKTVTKEPQEAQKKPEPDLQRDREASTSTQSPSPSPEATDKPVSVSRSPGAPEGSELVTAPSRTISPLPSSGAVAKTPAPRLPQPPSSKEAQEAPKKSEPNLRRAREASVPKPSPSPLPEAMHKPGSVSGPPVVPESGVPAAAPTRPVSPLPSSGAVAKTSTPRHDQSFTSTKETQEAQKKPEPNPQKARGASVPTRGLYSLFKPPSGRGTAAVPSPVSPASPSSATVKPQAPKYYQPPSEHPIKAILSLVVSGPMIFVLAIAYSYSLLKLPFVQGNFILTLLYGFLTGMAAGFALKWCKVLREGLAALVGLIAGLVAIYLSWVVWLYGDMGMFKTLGLLGLLDLVASPGRLWHLLGSINKTGAWEMWGYKPTGAVLWSLWSLEAVIVAVLSTFVAFIMTVILEGDVLCEACGTWCRRQYEVAKLRSCMPAKFKRHIDARDLAFLAALGAPPLGAIHWLSLSLNRCKKCGKTNTLDVSEVTQVTGSKGQQTKDYKTLVRRLLLTAAECDEIERIGLEATHSIKRF